MLVLLKGSVGVVSYDGNKLWCAVCLVSFCRHCAHLKIKKKRGEVKSFFSKTYSVKPRYERKAVSFKKIPFAPNSKMGKHLASLNLLKTDDRIVCEDEDVRCCSGEMTNCVQNGVKLITKSGTSDCEGKIINTYY